ncbi:single-strand binding protein [Zunongwangia mangrovi]|uniref:Single-stranded DNA-binding protein n=2 Tax=Zunongwangia mangrovi TaxID=1334022 RepID=A0A1I1N4A8_9FLAO|nr:single-strand binding protein [Zunongwangia mangrovi]
MCNRLPPGRPLNLFIMSTIRNKVQLIGNVGNTPEITNLDTSKKVARLSLATNDYYRNQKGESVQDTQWHNLVAWNKQAEIIENYVPKGKEIAIEGKLISRSYEDKEGNKRYVTEILVSEILLLGSKG